MGLILVAGMLGVIEGVPASAAAGYTARVRVLQRVQLPGPTVPGGFHLCRVVNEQGGRWLIAAGVIWWMPRRGPGRTRRWAVNAASVARTPTGVVWVVAAGSRGTAPSLVALEPNGDLVRRVWPVPPVRRWARGGIAYGGSMAGVAWTGGHLWVMSAVRTSRFAYYMPVVAELSRGGRRVLKQWTVPVSGGGYTAFAAGPHGVLWVGGNIGIYNPDQADYQGNATVIQVDTVHHTVTSYVATSSILRDPVSPHPNDYYPDALYVSDGDVWLAFNWSANATPGVPDTVWSLDPITRCWTNHPINQDASAPIQLTDWAVTPRGQVEASTDVFMAPKGSHLSGEVFWGHRVLVSTYGDASAVGVTPLGGYRVAAVVESATGQATLLILKGPAQ